MLLEELMKASVMSKAHIIAGAEGATIRQVLSVNIMDAPDIVAFLKHGDLLLTNGYLFKDKPDALVEFIRSMHAKGCAGLAVKTKRFSLDIPSDALEEAERLSFPLLELSMIETTLGDIFKEAVGILLDNKNKELHYALSIHKKFADMMLRGDGLAGIVDTLSSILSSPVLLLDGKYQPLAVSPHLLRPELAGVPELAAQALKGVKPPEQPLSLCIPSIPDSSFRHMACYPIATYRHEGCLLAFPPGYPLSGPELLALEQAAHVIGLELAKRHAVKERSRRYKNDFFSDLIEGYVGTEQEALHRGAKYGLRPDMQGLLILAREDAAGKSRRGGEAEERISSERDRHYELIKREFARLGNRFVMFAKNDNFGLLLFSGQEEWNEAALIKPLEKIAGDLHRSEGLSYSFGIGNPFAMALDLGLSYREALRALQDGAQMNRRRFALMYRSMDFGRLLRMLPNEEMERFYREAFKDLLKPGGQEQNEMLRTLKAYYENHCNLIDTAKALFVHRNTVVYRLEKAEKLLGRKLKDAQIAFGYRVAFAMEELLKNDNEKYVRKSQ